MKYTILYDDPKQDKQILSTVRKFGGKKGNGGGYDFLQGIRDMDIYCPATRIGLVRRALGKKIRDIKTVPLMRTT